MFGNGIDANTVNLDSGIQEVRDPLPTLMPMYNFRKNEVGTIITQGQHGMFSFNAVQSPLTDITNQVATQPLNSARKK